MRALKTVFDTCIPRADVLHGELRDEMFAAMLEEVAAGKADVVYQDPDTFFANTHPSSGLLNLLEEALGRLSGAKRSSAPVIRLETAFGGGKTHSLIALYHIVRNPQRLPASLAGALDEKLLPEGPVPVAAIVGNALDPQQGVAHGELRTYTVWGEMAYQLGAYEEVRKSDEERTAPGTGTLKEVLGGGPVLVLIDELARYLEVAQGVKVGKSTLADQTTAFLMALLDAASSADRAVVVYTLASSTDAFASQTERIQRAVAVEEARRVSARKEHVITPSREDEIASILRHRLFDEVDENEAQKTAQAYHQALVQELEKGGDLPSNAGQAGYATDIASDYPFHPELLRALNEKISTIPNFQRTRGALRLLARAVRRLWQTRPADCYLIHPHHIDLADDEILNDLTARLDRPVYKQVVEADIANPKKGAKAHAAIIDEELTKSGRPPFGARVATTVFLHSLVQGIAAGLSRAELNLAVFAPGDDLGLVESQTGRLLESCWFLDQQANRLKFSTEPSLNKVIADEAAQVGVTQAKRHLDAKIKEIWKRGGPLEPVFFPGGPQDVEDSVSKPKLVVIHYDAASVSGDPVVPPDFVVQIAERYGMAAGLRRYRNHVIFLVADEDHVENAVDRARHNLAIERVLKDPARLQELTQEQRKRLKGMSEADELSLRVAITRTFRHLFYPDGSAPDKHAKLSHYSLPPQDQGDVKRDQCEVVLAALKGLERVITEDSKPLAPTYLVEKAWTKNRDRVTTQALREAFAERPNLPILLDVAKLKESVKQGVRAGTWIYYDSRAGKGWSKDSPTTPLIDISQDTELVLSSAAHGIPIEGILDETGLQQDTCPVCGKPASACSCAEEAAGRQKVGLLRGEGAPGKAFQEVLDRAADAGAERIESLLIRIEGSDPDFRRRVEAIGLAVPQLPKAKAEFRLGAQVSLDLSDGSVLEVRFRGRWDRYRAVHDLLRGIKAEDVRQAAGEVEVEISFEKPLVLQEYEFQVIRDVFEQLVADRLEVEALPED